MHLVGFITNKFDTMNGHMNVKYVNPILTFYSRLNKLYVSQLSVHAPFLSFPGIIESILHSKSGLVLEVAVEDTVGEETSFNPFYTRDFTLLEFAQHEFL